MRAIGPSREVCTEYERWMRSRESNWNTIPSPSIAAKEIRGGKEMPSDPKQLTQAIELSGFNEASAAFGTGHATIVNVRFRSADGGKLERIASSQEVEVTVTVKSNEAIESPIIGFHVKDETGQPLFGDNTYLKYREDDLHIPPGEIVTAAFRFPMPILKTGHYSICAAVASGTRDNHVQHHWLHDALLFKVNSPLRNGVMIAIPMDSIGLKIEGAVGTMQ